jgi:hypothetical protein
MPAIVELQSHTDYNSTYGHPLLPRPLHRPLHFLK